MKYKCENCGAFYSDEDVTEEGEMREDYLGVRFWATFHYCPCCGEEVITDEDYEDTETIEDINKSLHSEWMRMALQEVEMELKFRKLKADEIGAIMNDREKCLREACEIVNGARNQTY